jgi:hypothetical protein
MGMVEAEPFHGRLNKGKLHQEEAEGAMSSEKQAKRNMGCRRVITKDTIQEGICILRQD